MGTGNRPAVGVDIGGTKVVGGLVDETGRILDIRRRATPGRDVGAVEDTIVDIVTDLTRHHPDAPVGIGAAGFVSADGTRVVFSPHLAWRDEPLRDRLRRRLGRPVLLDNDANAMAWAEYTFGAGAGQSHLVCLTLGTGIGGAVITRGVLEHGRHGMAGEFGHMVVVPGGHRCPCGNRGCWEQYASGNALGREARELARAHSPVGMDLLARVGGDPDAIEGFVVTAAAKAGDPTARELVAEVGQWLGLGLANLAAALDPGMFVVGGGVSEAGELLLEPARAALARSLTGRGFRPEVPVLAAALGPQAGLVGMADLARRAAPDTVPG